MPYVAHLASMGRPRGRPRLNVDYHVYNPALERPLVEELQRQADTVGLALAPYMDLLVSEAHEYHSDYLPELTAELPIRISMDELRRTTALLATEDCTPVLNPNQRRRVRLERPLANRIDRRCRELDVEYTFYLRTILRHAAGMPDGRARAEQTAIPFDLDSPREERVAS